MIQKILHYGVILLEIMGYMEVMGETTVPLQPVYFSLILSKTYLKVSYNIITYR